MATKKRILTIFFLCLAVPLVALAAAPKSLSVLINGKALSGKALWYDGKIYVPLKSVSKAIGGKYRYDSNRGLASVDLSGGRNITISPAERPSLKIVKYGGDSVRVDSSVQISATIVNNGLVTAREIEATCTFHGTSRNELVASMAQLPALKPGERKTIEFWLYEQRIPDVDGGRPYAQPISVPGAYAGRNSQHVYIGTDWQRVTYELEFDYLNPDNTYSTKKG